ncbi:MAG: histidine kinase [Candidatus Acidoferrum typicum]|nr:histidine kinase [Candidatus Acidoferrum typicum]
MQELEETLRAIRMGEVDAVLVSGAQGDQVFTLQGAEHPYRLLVETIDEGAATLSDDGTVLYSNKSFAAFFGVPLEKFIGAPLHNFVTGNDAEFLKTLILGARLASTRGEIRLQRKHGKPRTIRLTLSPNHELGLEAICAVATELTEIVDANEALRVTETSLRQLSARLLQLQDEERRRIARDLHDVTGQKIAVLSMSLDRLARLTEQRKPEAKESVKESREIVGQIGEEIRTLSYLLHPPLLDECGLASAVHWYAEGFEKRSGIKLEVSIGDDIPRLPIDAETTLFRVVQESLTNVHRYSGSSSAKIKISKDAKEVRLEIIDYGRGNKSGTARAGLDGPAPLGVGIPGMRERLHQLGGELTVDFATTGTRVTATLPVKKAAQEDSEENIDQTSLTFAIRSAEDARRRILIADDHELMRRGLRGLLESHDEWAVCGEAVEGTEAVRKSTDLKPDLVIMDVNLPGLSGIEAALQIRREREAAKVLFFTVHDSDEVIREIVEAGASGYVAKSRASQDLVDAVRLVLSGKTFFPNLVAAAAGRR